jgi:hypothetical protein
VRRAGRTRILGAVGFLAMLAATSLYFAKAGSNGRAVEPPPQPHAPSSTVPADTTPVRAMVPDAQSCSDVVGPIPAIRCTLDIGDVEYRLVGTGAVVDSYQAAIGTIRDHDRQGPPQCATGLDDERAWSDPSAPREPLGRYRCTVVDGRAEMWWTDHARGLVAHIRANDTDLARLFAWWQERGP